MKAYLMGHDPHVVLLANGTTLDRTSAMKYGYQIEDDPIAVSRIEHSAIEVFEDPLKDALIKKIGTSEYEWLTRDEHAAGQYPDTSKDVAKYTKGESALMERHRWAKEFLRKTDTDNQQRLCHKIAECEGRGDASEVARLQRVLDEQVAKYGKLYTEEAPKVAPAVQPLKDEPTPWNGQYAIRMPGRQTTCVLPNGDQVTFADAMKQGYEITDAFHMAKRLGYVGEASSATAAEIAKNLQAATRTQKAMAYSAAVLNLPEAADRPNAAAMIGTSYAETWSIERAQSFLRGLPREVADDSGLRPAERSVARASDDRLLRRTVELRLAAVTQNLNTQEARVEASALRYALDAHVNGGIRLTEALDASGVDVTQFDEQCRALEAHGVTL